MRQPAHHKSVPSDPNLTHIQLIFAVGFGYGNFALLKTRFRVSCCDPYQERVLLSTHASLVTLYYSSLSSLQGAHTQGRSLPRKIPQLPLFLSCMGGHPLPINLNGSIQDQGVGLCWVTQRSCDYKRFHTPDLRNQVNVMIYDTQYFKIDNVLYFFYLILYFFVCQIYVSNVYM